MKNLFLSPQCLQNGRVIIEGDTSHYLIRVRRIRKDEALCAVIGDRHYDLRVSSVERGRVICTIEHERGVEEHDPSIVVYQALLKQRKMELAVVKLAELGVRSLVPLVTDRSVPEDSSEGRVKRWRKLAAEGAKVSGTEHLMEIDGARRLIDVLKGLNKDENGVIILFCTGDTQFHVKQFLSSVPEERMRRFHLFFGPEGGFSDREVELVKSMGGVAVTMGALVLRSETAAVVGTGFVRLFCSHGDEV
jgi:16S rRNA (uracil1498-N3)-methyltransferase